MINQYPLWKYLLLVIVLVIGVIYALPNVYGEDPALQISAGRNTTIDTAAHDKVTTALQAADIAVNPGNCSSVLTIPKHSSRRLIS
jgi:preprotein translocase subunit SecD